MRQSFVLTVIAAALPVACASVESLDPAAKNVAPAPVASPAIPDTEIFLGRIERGPEGPVIRDLRNVTNHQSYDNQPYFVSTGDAFFYVAEGESGKTDIRRYDLKKGASEPVFVSDDRSEFSPKEAPGGGISYIQENPAGDITRVHRRMPGSDEGAPVADFAPLGYYAWLNGGSALGVYYRSEPGSLNRVEVATGATTLLREAIGRALQADPAGDNLWFTEIVPGDVPQFRLAHYRPSTGDITEMFLLPGGAQDLAVEFDSAGAATGIFSASGSTLFWRPIGGADDQEWIPVGDLSQFNIASGTRVAVSADGALIAIVGEKSN